MWPNEPNMGTLIWAWIITISPIATAIYYIASIRAVVKARSADSVKKDRTIGVQKEATL
jgi:hypothetical protein